jgi:tRNA(Arg) A34 adenosine deaminase TadA
MTLSETLKIEVSLPDWFAGINFDGSFDSDDQKMQLALELAQKNITLGGGPFGAVVFDRNTKRVFSAGVNLVLQAQCSVLHAEIVALMFAEKRIGSYSLASGAYELVTTSEPCAQCLGALCWSGIERLVCGASISDAEALGFDEGPLRDDWTSAIERRGIRVVTNVLRTEAVAVLSAYRASGGHVYNGRTP